MCYIVVQSKVQSNIVGSLLIKILFSQTKNNRQGGKKKLMKSKNFSWILWLVIIAAVVGVAIFALNQQKAALKEQDYTRFVNDLEAGKIQSVYGIAGYRFNVVLKDSTNAGKDNGKNYYDYYFYGSVGIHERVAEKIDQHNLDTQDTVQCTFENPVTTDYSTIIYYVVMAGLMIGLGIIIIRSLKNQNMQATNIGKSSARVSQNIKTRFSDVAGAEEEKEELVEIIDFLKNPTKYTEMGAKIPKGVLLVGPPGTGKTLFAKAVAGEAGVPFFSISGSDFVELYVGVGASRVRSLFEQAKKNMPCIIFIDEIDAVGRHRGAGLGGGNDEREQTLNQLLVELDGFEVNSGIIVMAATNRNDILDPALTRAGRFDRQIFVNRPDVRGREAILKVHARNKPLAKDVDFRALAKITPGFTGADLANVLNESAIMAVRKNHKLIFMEDVNEGLEKIAMGPAKRSRVVSESDKRLTAYHESGHAVLGSLLPDCEEDIHAVTIIPRGNAGGYTLSRAKKESMCVTKNKFIADITMCLGGRLAEELVLGDITTGASGDIKQATNIARDMVMVYGMTDELGMVFYGGDQEVFIGRDYSTVKDFSDETASKIDRQISKIINECYQNGKKLLQDNIDKLHVMASVLIAKETIFEDEVDMIMEGKSVEEVCAFIDQRRDAKEQENAKRIQQRLDTLAGTSAQQNVAKDAPSATNNSNDQDPLK